MRVFVALALGCLAPVVAVGVFSAESAKAQFDAEQHTEVRSLLPDVIRRAAVATRSSSGELAGARIGTSNLFVVYISSRGGCGSGGCRAQIWALENGQAVRRGTIAVGRLPIILLPQLDNGMPRIGVTTRTQDSRIATLPIAYDGSSYTIELWDHLLPLNVGPPLITASMLEAY